MRLKVRRNAGDGYGPYWEDFDIEVKKGMTVLDALFLIRHRQDDSLSFRYSCRGAVCGSCAMTINGRPRLACRTQISLLQEDDKLPPLVPISVQRGPFDPRVEVLIEPLPNMPVLKDLIVDQTEFFRKYRSLQPWLLQRYPELERENIMSKETETELDRYATCILCAACYGACPVNSENEEYLGPAALAKLYRFRIDPRDSLGGERLDQAPGPSGWLGCRFHTNCFKVCPKAIPPNLAIGKARQEMKGREGRA
ncbi:MAG: succinate dehydrogenase iron-sulfur subunit [Methanomassiliicoccales archaeon PtaU1.Bin124]|nr:MAG: succinate dehydrogenase iron-sulfur subunit [Methanomassiliicoccales archaeon PtaU1.Bin124]